MRYDVKTLLEKLLNDMTEMEYGECRKIFDNFQNAAMEQIKNICPAVSIAEKRLKNNGIKEFKDKVLSVHKKSRDDISYNYYLFSYNIWLADAELCTALDFSDDRSQDVWELKSNLSVHINELLYFIESFEKKYCKIYIEEIPVTIAADEKQNK